MRAKAILGFLMLASLAFGQAAKYDDAVGNQYGKPIPYAGVRICSTGAATGTNLPCTPLAVLYTDENMGTTLSNPVYADNLGNFSFYAPTGYYLRQIVVNGKVVQETKIMVGGTGSGEGGSVNGADIVPKTVKADDYKGKGPRIDVRYFGASGSNASTTANCTSGSKLVALTSAQDFSNGQGIQLYHCGAAVTLNTPSAPTAAVVGVTGSTTHTYKISAMTDFNGLTAPSSATTVTTANASMDYKNAVNLSWPQLTGTPSKCFIVWKDNVFAGLVCTPGWASRWIPQRPYGVNEYVQPRTWNGRYYKATGMVKTEILLMDGAAVNTNAGTHTITPRSMTGITNGLVLTMGAMSYQESVTVSNVTATTFDVTTTKTHHFRDPISSFSGSVEPTWCTTAGCTVTDGSITWTEQAYTWQDNGFGTWDYSPLKAIPYNAPATSLNDSLVTTIDSGAGTTSIVVHDAASNTITGTDADHDDTAAIQAAATYALTQQAAEQWAWGQSADGYSACLYFPWRKYKISSAIVPKTYCMLGEAYSVIDQTVPTRNVIDLWGGFELSMFNLSLWHGYDAIEYGNSNTGGHLRLEGVRIEGTWDYALMIRGTQTNPVNDDHMSSKVDWSGQVKGAKHILYNTTDVVNLTKLDASYHGGNLDGQAQIWNAGLLQVDALFAAPGRMVAGARWIDNRTAVTITKSRFGGEGSGGWPIVFDYAGYNTATGLGTFLGYPGNTQQYNGHSIIIRDSSVCPASGSPNSGVINFMDTVPARVIVEGNSCVSGDPTIRSNVADIDGSFWDVALGAHVAPPALQWQIGGNQFVNGITTTTVPLQAWPYIERADLALSAAPTAGIWQQNQKVRNSGTLATQAATGWVNLRTGRAAPAWQANHSYTVGQFVLPTTDNAHAYMVVVAGTSNSSEPTWLTTTKSLTTDNTVKFAEVGASAKWVASDVAGCDGTNLTCTDGSGPQYLTVNDVERPSGVINRIPYSDDFSHWNQYGTSITTGQADPWGGTGATLITRDGAAGAEHFTSTAVNATAITATQYVGCWAKAGTLNTASLAIWDVTAGANAGFTTQTLPSSWGVVYFTLSINPAHTFLGLNVYPGGTGQVAGTISLAGCWMANEKTYYEKTGASADVSGLYGATFHKGIMAANIHGGSASTGSIAGSSSAVVTVTWSDGGFADANYFPSCSVKASELTGATLRGHHVTAQTATTVDYLVVNDDSSEHTGTVSCTGIR